jgi:hypothetical protein
MGEKGTGKSVFELSFPKVYALDSEAGLAWYEGGEYAKNLLGIVNTQDFNDVSGAIDEIVDMTEEDPDAVGTFSIDSETKFHQNLTDAALQLEEKKAKAKGKDEMDSAVSMRGWGRIKSVATRLQNAKIDLSAKGVNIVSVAQIDDVKTKVGENFVKVGEKPVMQKGAEFDYDVVIKLFVEGEGEDVVHKGVILKDRTSVTRVGQIVENPSYEIWREHIESRKNADKLDSKLRKDANKAINTLEDADIKAAKSVIERLTAYMKSNDEAKEKALKFIKLAKITNPATPSDEELRKIEKFLDKVEE